MSIFKAEIESKSGVTPTASRKRGHRKGQSRLGIGFFKSVFKFRTREMFVLSQYIFAFSAIPPSLSLSGGHLSYTPIVWQKSMAVQPEDYSYLSNQWF